MSTYHNDDEHIKALCSNSVVVLFLKVVDDPTNEKWHDKIAQTATDQEKHTERDGAALTVGIAANELEGLASVLLGPLSFCCDCCCVFTSRSLSFRCGTSLA